MEIALRLKMMPKQQLEDAFKTYTGKTLDESDGTSLLEPFVEGLDNDRGCQKGIASTSGTEHRPTCWQPGRQFLKAPTFISSDAGIIFLLAGEVLCADAVSVAGMLSFFLL
jgi:hypothetical protein